MLNGDSRDRLATLAWIGAIGVASLTLVGARAVEDRVVARRERRRLSGAPEVHTRKAKHAISALKRSIDQAEAARPCSFQFVEAVLSAEHWNASALDHTMAASEKMASAHGAQSGRMQPLRDRLHECVRARGFITRRGAAVN